MPLDYEAFESSPRTYFVEVEVSDGSASTKTEVWIDVEPVNEFAPMFIEGDTTTREINETAEIGVNIGEPVSATDMDAGETLTYSIGDADAGAFEIDSRTGQLRTKAALNYQTKPVHTVKVVVSDGSQTDSISITIQVLSDIVEVPDASLATMLRLVLHLGPNADITKEAMSELTSLDADGNSRLAGLREIHDLTGLEHAKNLTTLLLTSNSITDLTPLKGLTQLTTLEIYANHVVYLTGLEDLTSLTSLNLGYNRINKITGLEDLTSLTSLHLESNNIKDLTPLKGLTNLTELDLADNMIRDVTPLENLTNLTTLELAYNTSLTDVSALSGLVNLETLTLEGCAVTDFTPLADLTATIDVLAGSAPAANGNGIGSLLDPAVLKTLDRETLQSLLRKLSVESDGSLKYQRAIAMLESTLASMRPDKTVLLANYPNPFNPETWIPYHLAKAADVQITIYNMHGTVVRNLELGHLSAGYYMSRSQAAYWDGKNAFGEHVASGIYFYQLQADTMSPLRKMVILK